MGIDAVRPSGAVGLSRVFIFLVFAAAWPALATDHTGTTALERYVFAPDPTFSYSLQATIPAPTYTAYVILMDSLTWRSPDEVDRQRWTHQVLIVVPDEVTNDTALMVVNGGSNADEPPDELLLGVASLLAVSTRSVLAAVSQIPNQPLLFPDELAPISEDALVAYSWDKAMDTGDPTWAAYLPMTKASVRALDTVQEFVNETVANVTINDFVVTGFSKRGATAWLVAAVDPRVRAVAPGVFDVLNMPLQIERHYRSYGFYSSAIEDYVQYDIVGRVRSPEGRFLTKIVDPLSYAATLELPKLLLNATGDQFFLPDAANFYIGRLPGETLIRQVPNTDHGFANGLFDALDSLLAWYQTILDDTARPQLNWSFDDDGTLTVTSDPPAETATLWQAVNANARDFRLETIGAAWTDSPLSQTSPGTFEVTAPTPPAGGYLGYLVVLRFAGEASQQTYGTPVFVTPQTLPFELDDPVLLPQDADYWRCQLPDDSVTCPSPPDYLEAEIQAFLPLPVFGRYANSLEVVQKMLADSPSSVSKARRHCMATRLNIAAGELGWYSKVSQSREEVPLWRIYGTAEIAFARHNAERAAQICQALNENQVE